MLMLTSENVSYYNCKTHVHISCRFEVYYYSKHAVPFAEVEGCYCSNKYSNAEQAGQVWDTFPAYVISHRITFRKRQVWLRPM